MTLNLESIHSMINKQHSKSTLCQRLTFFHLMDRKSESQLVVQNSAEKTAIKQ